MAKGRRREQPINPIIQRWMDDNGCETLSDVSRKTGISRQTLEVLAEPTYQNKELSKHVDFAHKFGVSLDAWITGITRKPAT